MVSRTDRTQMAEWWRTIDKPLLGAILFLMLFGLVLSFAASPPVAERIGAPSLHFVKRHAVFLIPAIFLLIAGSMLTPKQVRRAAFVIFSLGIILMLITMFVGSDVKGSRRWIQLGSFSVQPSEFVKPAFVIISAWLFAENSRRADIPGNLFSIILFAIVAALLVSQPDFGQTMLLAIVWGALFFMAGMTWIWIAALGGLAVLGMGAAYTMFPYVAGRVNRFVTGEGDNFQVDAGREAIISGGWMGKGPGEGTVKNIIPDGHADFPFAVAAEEYGILVCIGLVAVFAFIVLRGLSHAMRERDAYVRLASSGLLILFGMQSMINISVNLQLIPAKGMTLPFISYGGSSMLSMAICMGFVLALTRKRPESRGSDLMRFTPAKFEPAE